MKKKNYDFMTQYESNMLTSSTVGYTRNIPRREITKIAEVYKEETGKDNNDNPYCSGCLVNILAEIKELYDAHDPDKLQNEEKGEKHEGKKQSKSRATKKVQEPGRDAEVN